MSDLVRQIRTEAGLVNTPRVGDEKKEHVVTEMRIGKSWERMGNVYWNRSTLDKCPWTSTNMGCPEGTPTPIDVPHIPFLEGLPDVPKNERCPPSMSTINELEEGSSLHSSFEVRRANSIIGEPEPGYGQVARSAFLGKVSQVPQTIICVVSIIYLYCTSFLAAVLDKIIWIKCVYLFIGTGLSDYSRFFSANHPDLYSSSNKHLLLQKIAHL